MGGIAAGAAATPWSWGYYPYQNPYSSAPVVLDGVSVDYSSPIVLNVSSAPEVITQSSQSATQEPAGASTDFSAMPMDRSTGSLESARADFARGDYASALAQCNKAIANRPNDPLLHEFRGLALFAQGQYKEAAGTVYAVLSVGPGWDWATMIGFYPRVETYTAQLRALEQAVRANPDQAETRFLVGYHYMTGGHNDAAAAQFKAAVQLNPADQLSAQLAGAITKSASPAPPAPPSPAIVSSQPVDASTLQGDWKAVRADGGTIMLSLKSDATFAWSYAQKEKAQEFKGTYSVADGMLILNQGSAPAMIGQVTFLSDSQFNFKRPGGNPNDPGLTFGK